MTGAASMKILVIEDDDQTAAYIVDGLRIEGHDLDQSANGLDGLALALARDYDVLVVDRLLPGLDGLAVVRALREAGRATPVLFLTCVGGVDDRGEGLEAGADDYLLKPFSFFELLARIDAIGRRTPTGPDATVLNAGSLEMDLIARTVTREGRRIDLQPGEFGLLEVLMRNCGRVLTRTMLLERVWDLHFEPKINVVEAHIRRLRSKVDTPFAAEMIHTVHDAGYSLGPMP
jgi:two-component system OmpR family response regulator